MVRIQLLGPVRAWRDGAELDLGGPRQQAVLALLAAGAAAGSTTSPAELVDTLWPESPPATAENMVQTYLKRLRRRLEPDRPPRTPSRLLRRVAGGYTLDLSDVDLDVVRFRRLVAAAVEAEWAGDRHSAGEHLREALGLWRGAPLANLAILSGHAVTAGLSGERWAAVARYGETLLATGEAGEALPALVEAATASPLDEAAQARLIRAYQAVGDRAQAFATYQAARHRLADGLGVDPGPELTAAHDALLAEDGRPATVPEVVPAQLPPVTPMFTGRLEQLRQLDKLLPTENGGMTIAIVGAAGVGKTTLAVRWAHLVAERFPDGQLFVNLRGFDPAGSAMDPGEAVRGFLEALEVSPRQLPTSLDAQVGRYRSLLAGRRMLIVLDNARDAAQVRPLLPGSPGPLVVMTSRDQLVGLVTTDGGVPLRLDLLTAEEATELMTRRLGADRVAAEPEALAEVLRRCAGLPLALAIVAARTATRPEFGLATIAAELREASTGLDPFAGGDQTSDLRAVLFWSYRELTPEAARLFRLLAVHPGPDISTAATASLAGVPAARVRSLLSELTRAHLLDEPAPGRFAFHDLVRDYATELTDTVDSDQARRTATHRMLDHYLHTAHAAATALEPLLNPIALDPPLNGVTPEPIADRDPANRWFGTERRTLLGCVSLAATAGFDRHACQLTWCLFDYLGWRGHWRDHTTIARLALAAAVRLGDRRAQARTHGSLANGLSLQGQVDEATDHFQRGIALHEELDDLVGQARTHHNLAWLLTNQGHLDMALNHDQRSLALYRAAGHRAGEARVLNSLAWNHALAGDHEQALGHGQRALDILHQHGDGFGEALAADTVGYAHHHLGDHEQAIGYFERALAQFRETGHRYQEGETLTHLGDSQHAAGHPAEAGAAWRAALTIFRELGHADADQVRSRLTGQAGQPGVDT